MKKIVPLIGCGFVAASMLIISPAYAQQTVAPSPPTDSHATRAVDVDGYKIGPQDVLEISVWKEDTLKKEVLVRPDGGMSFPLVGDIHAAGKTAAQLQQEITQKLEKYMPDPVVSVALLKVLSNTVYVIPSKRSVLARAASTV